MRHQRTDKATQPVLTTELARDLGVSRVTAYVMCRSGEVPAEFRAGRFELDRKAYPKILEAAKAARATRTTRTAA